MQRANAVENRNGYSLLNWEAHGECNDYWSTFIGNPNEHEQFNHNANSIFWYNKKYTLLRELLNFFFTLISHFVFLHVKLEDTKPLSLERIWMAFSQMGNWTIWCYFCIQCKSKYHKRDWQTAQIAPPILQDLLSFSKSFSSSWEFIFKQSTISSSEAPVEHPDCEFQEVDQELHVITNHVVF